MSKFHLKDKIDFTEHNREVKKIYEAYNKGTPIRVPISYSMNSRMILMNQELNKNRITFREYFENPDVRWQIDLEFQKWVRFNVLQDSEMGFPDKEWAGIGIGYQNCDEAAWFGCPIVYPENDMPFILPILKEDKKKLYILKNPEPFSGIIAKALEDFYYLEEKRKKIDFEGFPVGKTAITGAGTDGPLTVACNIRGTNEVVMDFYEDPQYLRDLLSFITENTIIRMKKIREFLGMEVKSQGLGFADDSIELISNPMYQDFILPYHKKFLEEFSVGGPNSIHLCGKVEHHLKFLTDNLNIKTFDLGFPVDLGKARKRLGREVTLIGNIPPHLLKQGPEEKIKEEVKKLCTSGVMDGGKFILHDGNNCAPETPVEHFKVMYETGKKYGTY